jgi:predicted AAA+ superfamily ATPase
VPIIPRHLSKILERTISTSRIVNVVGPRQDGKSTLVRDLMKSAAYVTLDDNTSLRALEEDPYNQLKALSRQAPAGLPVVIDEIQRLPGLTLALKRIVDEDNRKAHFVLTGSSDIFTSGASVDSLAGRVSTLTLRPFSTAEIFGSGPFLLLDAVAVAPQDPIPLLPPPRSYERDEAIELIIRGGFPEMREIADRDRGDRYTSYIDSIIERDMSAIHAVRKPDAVRRLISQAAARTGQEFNPWTIAGQLGIKFETLTGYVDALTRLGIVLRLGAWTSSKAKREIKSPKLHLMDTGFATALRDEDASSFGPLADPASLGALFETFVFTEIEKSLPFLSKRWSLWHWRDNYREIDIVAEAPGRLLALFEMKASSDVSSHDFKHINWFMTEGPGTGYRGAGFVVYLGDRVLSFGSGRIALPASMFWSYPSS